MTERQITHWVGDTCEGGHRPTLVERLRGKRDYLVQRFLAPSGNAVFATQSDADDFGEAADRLERMEAVVAAARLAIDGKTDVIYAITRIEGSLAALDGQVVSGDENKSTHHNLRTCPNAVSWCYGPDRFMDICVACLATWTEEAKEKNGRYDESDDMCPNCVTPWKCNGPHLYEQTKAWAANQHEGGLSL